MLIASSVKSPVSHQVHHMQSCDQFWIGHFCWRGVGSTHEACRVSTRGVLRRVKTTLGS